MGDNLLRLGLMTEIDGPALSAYCVAWARWREAERKLQEFGIVVTTPNGFFAQSPYLGIANRALEQMMKVLIEFGMTPSSRTRVKAAPKAAKADPLEEFIGS